MNLKVELNRESKLYSPGDILKGSIFLNSSKDPDLKCIKVRLYGAAVVQWNEKSYEITQGSDGHEETVKKRKEFSNTEVYMDDELILNQNEIQFDLNENKYKVQFKCKIPQLIPQSYESPMGQISYSIFIEIVQNGIISKTVKIPFYIKSLLSCAFEPSEYRDIFLCKKSKRFWSNLGGKISASLKLPKRLFICGESIGFSVEICNETCIRIKQIQVQLLEVSHYKAKDLKKLKSSSKILQFVDGPEFLKDPKIHWADCLKISQNITLSHLDYCSIMAIEYFLVLSVKIKGYAKRIQMKIPIVIGSTY